VAEQPDIRMAVDIGGTFTDVVLERGEERLTRKVLTTAGRPEEGVLDGARRVLAEANLHFSDIAVFIHGTTLATNAIIERRGARTALIATQGFRDVLEIATESRYDQYDLTIEKPRPLVPRALRLTVPERVDVNGTVRLALDEAAVAAHAGFLRHNDIESIAVCFLHAYANPAHERRAGAILREALPALAVTLSCEVCPEIREYERTSTAVANAYVQPLMDGYLGRMDAALREQQFRGALCLITSGGGLTSLETARRFPVRLVESGPAGGAIFAAQVAARANERKALSFDMGGTTAKIALIEDFEPRSARVYEVDRAARFLKGSGLPVRIPVIEMVEIGAGGGSIAGVDALGRVVLGLIDPQAFAGGTIALETSRAYAALARDVGAPLALSAETAAYAVHEMVCETMAGAARVHAVERGAATGEHTLIAFGGAAPLHAARVAEKIGAARVVVPPHAGVGSAIGFLAAPVSYEIVRSRHMRLDRFDAAAVSGLLADMAREAHSRAKSGARGAPLSERRLAYMRYVGQGHEIAVPLPERDMTSDDAPGLREAFEREYAALFKRPIPGAAIETLSWSVLVSTAPRRPQPAPAVERYAAAANGTRRVFDGRAGQSVEVPLYRRERLPPGARVSGPAIIAEDATSTFVSASFDAHIDAAGCIVMNRKAGADEAR
jgi:N-methylhydantoinase A